jgi:hypothetical protein
MESLEINTNLNVVAIIDRSISISIIVRFTIDYDTIVNIVVGRSACYV